VGRGVRALLPAILRESQVGSRSSGQGPLRKTLGPEEPMHALTTSLHAEPAPQNSAEASKGGHALSGPCQGIHSLAMQQPPPLSPVSRHSTKRRHLVPSHVPPSMPQEEPDRYDEIESGIPRNKFQHGTCKHLPAEIQHKVNQYGDN
jgi:hypothetical protein